MRERRFLVKKHQRKGYRSSMLRCDILAGAVVPISRAREEPYAANIDATRRLGSLCIDLRNVQLAYYRRRRFVM